MHDGVSIHRHHDCLPNCLFRRRSKKPSKLRVTGLCVGNSPVTGEFPAQRASNAEKVFIWWRHHEDLTATLDNKHHAGLHWDYYPGTLPLTHWGRDEMYNISQTTFSNVFSSMKMFEFQLKFHWSLFLRVQLTCVTRPQWVKSRSAVTSLKHMVPR